MGIFKEGFQLARACKGQSNSSRERKTCVYVQCGGVLFFLTLKNNNTEKRSITVSSTTNLALGNWPDPQQDTVQSDDHYTDDPEDLCVVCLVIAEDDGEDDATKVAGCTNDAR